MAKYHKVGSNGKFNLSTLHRFEGNGIVFSYVTYDWQVPSCERGTINVIAYYWLIIYFLVFHMQDASQLIEQIFRDDNIYLNSNKIFFYWIPESQSTCFRQNYRISLQHWARCSIIWNAADSTYCITSKFSTNFMMLLHLYNTIWWTFC